MDHEDLGRPATQTRDKNLVVIGRPIHALHQDLNVGILLIESLDQLQHGPAVRPGESIPETDFRPGGSIQSASQENQQH